MESALAIWPWTGGFVLEEEFIESITPRNINSEDVFEMTFFAFVDKSTYSLRIFGVYPCFRRVERSCKTEAALLS